MNTPPTAPPATIARIVGTKPRPSSIPIAPRTIVNAEELAVNQNGNRLRARPWRAASGMGLIVYCSTMSLIAACSSPVLTLPVLTLPCDPLLRPTAAESLLFLAYGWSHPGQAAPAAARAQRGHQPEGQREPEQRGRCGQRARAVPAQRRPQRG